MLNFGWGISLVHENFWHSTIFKHITQIDIHRWDLFGSEIVRGPWKTRGCGGFTIWCRTVGWLLWLYMFVEASTTRAGIWFKQSNHVTRWAPTCYKWSYNSRKWPYKWVYWVITLLTEVITPLVTRRGPPCRDASDFFGKPICLGPIPQYRSQVSCTSTCIGYE